MLHRIILKIRSSMTAKIALIVTLPVVIISSFFSYYHYALDRDWVFHIAESRLLFIGEGVKGSVEALIKKGEYAGVQNLAVETARGADIESVIIFSEPGQVIASNDKKWTGKNLLDLRPERISNNDIPAIQKSIAGGYSVYYDPQDNQYHMVMPVSYGKDGTGALFISLDLRSMQDESRGRMVEDVLISILAAVLAGISIYFFLHFFFTVRLRSVSSAAVKFASGDLSVRADTTGTDEIGYLATSFNLLAEEITNWRANLEEMAANRMKELSALYEIVNTISQSLELNKVLPSVLDRVLENLGAEKGVVVLVGSDGRTLTPLGHRGLTEEGVRRISQSGQGCAGDVILRNSPVRVPADDEEGPTVIPGLELEDISSALVVPITARGKVLGVIGVYSGLKNKFSGQDESLLMMIGSQVAVAVENALLYEKTLELARLDGLTGLANRRYLMEQLRQELERAERYQTSLSVLILDLDRFKSFNDTHGHQKGDELLRSFASLMKGIVRTADIAGRYGGEEFFVVLPNTSSKGAALIAERIRKAMEDLKIPVGSGQPSAGRTVSIGVAEFSAGDSVEKLITIADGALYRAKKSGRNRVVSQ